ncbi:uncharacterized protein [Cicer arietinum]
MEGYFNETLHDTQKVEKEESLSKDKEVVAVEVASAAAADDDDCGGKSKSLSDTQDVVKIDEQVENALASETVELELKEEKKEDFISLEDNDGFSSVMANHVVEQTELPSSEDNNEGLRETEVVEAIKDMTGSEEEKNVLFSNEVNISSSLPLSDVVSRGVYLEKSGSKSDEGEKGNPPKGIEQSLVTSTYEKVEEQSDIQESSSYESAKETLQPSSNFPDSESNSAAEQVMIEESRSIENPENIFPVTQRQHTSWKSCCGLFEIMRRGDR